MGSGGDLQPPKESLAKPVEEVEQIVETKVKDKSG
jgi:hypothetical protein